MLWLNCLLFSLLNWNNLKRGISKEPFTKNAHETASLFLLLECIQFERREKSFSQMWNSYQMVFTVRLLLLAQLSYLLSCIMVGVVSIIDFGCRLRCSVDILIHISSKLWRKCFFEHHKCSAINPRNKQVQKKKVKFWLNWKLIPLINRRNEMRSRSFYFHWTHQFVHYQHILVKTLTHAYIQSPCVQKQEFHISWTRNIKCLKKNNRI